MVPEPEVGRTGGAGDPVELADVVLDEDVDADVEVARQRFCEAQERSVGQHPPPSEAGQE